MAVEMPAHPAQAPMACPRSSGAKLASTMARLPGTIIAPATPWSTRAVTRSSRFGANAHITEVTEKPIAPITNTRRRPYWSPSAPPRTISALSAIMYPLRIHCSPPRRRSRSRPMAGNATLTTLDSRKAAPEPRITAASAHRPRVER